MASTVGNITNIHTLSHIVANTTGSTVISQLSNVSATPGINLLVSAASGDVYPRFIAPQSQTPEIRFDTTQVKTILDLVSTTTQLWDATATDAILYFEKSSALGVRAGSTVHTTLTMETPIIICPQITAAHRTQAVASCRLLNVYDGTTAPVVASGSAALAFGSGSKTDAEHYVLGGISIGGAFLTDGVQDVTIDFGQQFFGGESGIGADGTNYTTFWGINTITPVITIRTHNLGWVAYGLNGAAQGACIVYLRKILASGPDVDANATAIKITGTAGFIHVDDATGGGQEAATGAIRLTQSAALTITSTAAAITA